MLLPSGSQYSRAQYGAEYPHPTSHPVSCTSCKKAGVDLHGKWVGYQGIAYQGSGGPTDRWNELWVDTGADASGKPGNKWVNLLKENYTKNIPADWRRPLPTSFDQGLEAELRMRGGKGTSIKYGTVYEIIPPKAGLYTSYRARKRVNRMNYDYYNYNPYLMTR